MSQSVNSGRVYLGILDSGAEGSSIPKAMARPLPGEIVEDREKGNKTTYVYGNNQILEALGHKTIGKYRVDIMPKPVTTALVSVPQIVDAGHTVLFDKDKAVITDVEGRYKIEYPRGSTLSWKVPLEIFSRLSELRGSRKRRRNAMSGRLHTKPSTTRERVIDLHNRMGHAPEDIMCRAIGGDSPTWIGVDVTEDQIRKVFKKEPCLFCALGKRRMEGKDHWRQVLRDKTLNKTGDLKDRTNNEEINLSGKTMDDGHRKWEPGELITVDNLGPVNPESQDGFKHFFLFKDMGSGSIFTYLSDTVDEDSYLYALAEVLDIVKRAGHKTKVVRTDYFSTFISDKVQRFESANDIIHESSSPYAHWQNGVEREVQSISKYLATILHAQPFLRADMWSHALEHWTELHNDLPFAPGGGTPNMALRGAGHINAKHKYRFALGDMVIHGLPKPTRKWKFDVRNDLGLYIGDIKGMKGACRIYSPYEHKIIVRNSVAKISVSSLQYLAWYGQRHAVREGTLKFQIVRNSLIDLLGEEFEEQVDTDTRGDAEEPSYWTEPEESAGDEDSTSSSDETNIDEIDSYIEEGNEEQNSREAMMSRIFMNETKRALETTDIPLQLRHSMTQLHLEAPHIEDQLSEEVSTKDALNAPDRDKFIEAIRKEVESLISTTRTLVPITAEEAQASSAIQIGTTLKCKRKKKGDGSADKHKARAAARGDQLARIYKARGIKPPESFSPTVSAVTFALLLQVAVSKGLHMATTDITAAYLQVPYSKSDPVIITKLEENIAKICGLDPNQLFRINKYLYGLPNSGRAFYYHYRAALEKEGYRCSRIDPCLFIKAQNEEKVYIIIHVDDTFVFADNRDDLKTFTDQMNKHFPMTLDTAADSFLGMKINRTEEGDIELSQPKLVEKLLKECNELSRQPRKLTTHPYGPPRSHNAEDKDSKPCYGKQEANKETYLRILGMLMYLTRSRPDILTAVSYCATKSSSPEPDDMEHLYNIAKYISDTKDSKYIISRGIKEQKITIICEVDAGYLSHHDSKSHTGYAIKFSGSNGFFYIRSNKQKTVATSSTHAEMQAVHTLVKDILYILQLLEDMGEEVNLPVVIMEDNSAVIQTSTGEAAHLKRCKHFLMIINYVREQVERGYIELRKIKGEDNTSDILTKRVRTKDFRQKAKRLMGSHD